MISDRARCTVKVRRGTLHLRLFVLCTSPFRQVCTKESELGSSRNDSYTCVTDRGAHSGVVTRQVLVATGVVLSRNFSAATSRLFFPAMIVTPSVAAENATVKALPTLAWGLLVVSTGHFCLLDLQLLFLKKPRHNPPMRREAGGAECTFSLYPCRRGCHWLLATYTKKLEEWWDGHRFAFATSPRLDTRTVECSPPCLLSRLLSVRETQPHLPKA